MEYYEFNNLDEIQKIKGYIGLFTSGSNGFGLLL